eukprot:3147446-Pleurochrysis_carterae.AAC.1
MLRLADYSQSRNGMDADRRYGSSKAVGMAATNRDLEREVYTSRSSQATLLDECPKDSQGTWRDGRVQGVGSRLRTDCIRPGRFWRLPRPPCLQQRAMGAHA